MTISRMLRKRLRRYALFCLMAATSAGVAQSPQWSFAGNTHDSTDLCGWVDEPAAAEAPSSVCTPPSQSKSSVPSPSHLPSKPQAPSQSLAKSAETNTPPFISVRCGTKLSIDTCNYDAWLAGTLTQRDGSGGTASSAKHAAGANTSVANATSVAAPQGDEAVETPSGDKAPVTVAAANDAPAGAPASRTASEFNKTLATIAAAASAGNPIPFSQWTEPFAMVGPDGSHTPQEIRAFQAWVNSAHQFVNRFRSDYQHRFVPVVDFDGVLDCPGPVPADAESELTLVQTATAESAQEMPLKAELQLQRDALVGSSGVIASIEEAYLPYDLAERDLPAEEDPAKEDPAQEDLVQGEKDAVAPSATEAAVVDAEVASEPGPSSPEPAIVWADGLFESPLQPFCIRSMLETRSADWSPLAMKADPNDSVATVPMAYPEDAAEPVDLTSDPAGDVLAELDAPGEAESNLAVAAIAKFDDADEVAEQPNAVEDSVDPTLPSADLVYGSAECLFDEWVWRASNTWEANRDRVGRTLRPKRLGKRLAGLVVNRDRLAGDVANQLASVWPAVRKGGKVAPGSGARLVARAEAATRPDAEQPVQVDSTESITPEQLAQADAILRQWVDVARSVFDDVSNRFDDVTEVARNRGTQVDSTRR